MTYVKRLTIHGFKSFANKVDIPFDERINVIMGPNGSGKSNVSDALCFVLGRLSAKSMRAAKSSNLLFQGTKVKKPAKEAYVEIAFDNSDNVFSIDSNELVIKRIVRRNGQSIYQLNGQTKTRQEIIETLSQVGIDSNGFNIVLQGEISRLVKMHSNERREIIEEVAGISIYELRKQKSLHEIEKTKQKLSEVSAVLRERTSYLKNLEQERKQALRFKELEKTIKQCKASLLKKHIDEKEKQLAEIDASISKNKDYREKVRKEISDLNSSIGSLDERINEINKYIQQTTGFERDALNEEITDLNVKIAADLARKENFEKKLVENKIRKEELELNLKETLEEVEELRKKSPIVSKRQEDLKNKKRELEKIEEEKSKLRVIENEFNSLRGRIRDKEKFVQSLGAESKLLFNQINQISGEISFQTIEECEKKIVEVKEHIVKKEEELEKLLKKKSEIEKALILMGSDISANEKVKSNIPKGMCPLCRTELTPEHINSVVSDSNDKIEKAKSKINLLQKELEDVDLSVNDATKAIASLKDSLSCFQVDLVKLNNLQDKKKQMKGLMENEKSSKDELGKMQERMNFLEQKIKGKESIDDKYDELFFEMQEISSRTDENLDTTILHKEREADRIRSIVKNILKDEVEIKNEVGELSSNLSENQKVLREKEKASQVLNEKFKKLYDERTEIQEKIKQKNMLLVNKQNALSRFEDLINNLKIDYAKESASKESFEFELREFPNVSFISGSIQFLQEKLRKSENDIAMIGSVNLRALETYEQIKVEYEKISEKALQLEKERDEILKVIAEIDAKKKRTFMKTFNAINELFTKNFSELSVKGKAFLEIENKEDIFEGGVNITIKIAKGKYFDVTSLSGGEQTLVALSLIFAIQEYNPYHFYIFDEIDAALDKRNSELLANLLKKYMKKGQYLVISHNDSIITNANVVYGVSMNSGISKVISLKLEEEKKES